MILLIIVLWSLSAVFITRLLSKKGMKVASILYTALYAYIITWIYLIFVIDVADIGFVYADMRESLIYGSDIYHSFGKLYDTMYLLPEEVLTSIVCVSVVVLVASLVVVFVGGWQVSREIYRNLKSNYIKFLRYIYKKRGWNNIIVLPAMPILSLFCRANC